jgi:hypothetical protein
MDIDTTTINRAKLESLPLAVIPRTYQQQSGMGNGCAGDPPGFPSYFTRHVYTEHGNSPSNPKSIDMTILGRVLARVRDNPESLTRRLRALWSPLPLDHPRTVAWIRDRYRHLARCYSVPDRLEYGRPKTLCAGSFGDFAHKTFDDDPRFSDDWRAKERAAVDAYNRDVDAEWARIAVPGNHCAVRAIREFYPDYAPDLELIAHPPTEVEGDWWAVYASRPSPEDCPGMLARWGRVGGHTVTHPLNGNWCQVCGWHATPAHVDPKPTIAPK